jgi:hypothetical protein
MTLVGVYAVPIVVFISILVGIVLALNGAQQLRQFGAAIFIANLVGISMTREMGPLITAIIVAAVFALGSLLFTITALAIAPQTVMFAALTHVAPGVDKVRRTRQEWDPNAYWQMRGAEFRWITLPLVGGMVLGAVTLVFGVSSIGD